MKNKYPKIFEPITVKKTTIRNRIAMTPMGTNYGETSGEMSNRHMNYYSLRAKGGTGLIILENANVEYPVGSNGTSQIRIDHDSFMPRYYQLVENLHKYVPGLGRFLRKIRLALFEQGLRFALQFLRDTTFQ